MDALERRLTPWLDAVCELVRRPGGEFPHHLLMCLLSQTFEGAVGWNSVSADDQERLCAARCGGSSAGHQHCSAGRAFAAVRSDAGVGFSVSAGAFFFSRRLK